MPNPYANQGNLNTLKNMIKSKNPPNTTCQPHGTGIRALIAFVLALCLAGCGGGMNHAKVRQAIIDELETTEVTPIPGKNFEFIARGKGGEVWYVQTYGSEAKVTAKTLLFSGSAEHTVR